MSTFPINLFSNPNQNNEFNLPTTPTKNLNTILNNIHSISKKSLSTPRPVLNDITNLNTLLRLNSDSSLRDNSSSEESFSESSENEGNGSSNSSLFDQKIEKQLNFNSTDSSSDNDSESLSTKPVTNNLFKTENSNPIRKKRSLNTLFSAVIETPSKRQTVMPIHSSPIVSPNLSTIELNNSISLNNPNDNSFSNLNNTSSANLLDLSTISPIKNNISTNNTNSSSTSEWDSSPPRIRPDASFFADKTQQHWKNLGIDVPNENTSIASNKPRFNKQPPNTPFIKRRPRNNEINHLSFTHSSHSNSLNPSLFLQNEYGNSPLRNTSLSMEIDTKSTTKIFTINGQNYLTEFLGAGKFKNTYQFDKKHQGQSLLLNGHNYPIESLIVKEICIKGSNLVPLDPEHPSYEKRRQAAIIEQELAYDRYANLGIPVPKLLLRSAQSSNKNFVIVEKMDHAISSDAWIGFNGNKTFEQLTDPASRACLEFAKDQLTRMANQATLDQLCQKASYYIDDFRYDNVRYNIVNGQFDIRLSDQSTPEGSENEGRTVDYLRKYALDWSGRSLRNICNPTIFNWLIADFPEAIKNEIINAARINGDID